MGKGRHKKILYRFLFFIILFVLSIYFLNAVSYKYKDYQYAEMLALQQAEIEMGTGCDVMSSEYDYVNREYQIVIANAENNRIITYLVDTNNNKMQNYSVKKFVDRQLRYE